jgi:hypothetical protein
LALLLLAAVALWLFDFALMTLGKPFASLYPLALILGLAAGFVGIGLVASVFASAFGEGQSRDEYKAKKEGHIRVWVEQNVEILQQHALKAAKKDQVK